jgi:hypothetical protein
MKTKLLVLVLLAGGSMFAQTRFSFGVNIGGRAPGYYTAPAYAVARPAYPGPGYIWVDGYWAENYGRRVWVAGYWTRPAPRYERPRYDERYERGLDRDRDRRYGHDDGRGYGSGFRGR